MNSICCWCGSPSVVAETKAHWHIDKQRWETVLQDRVLCDDCGACTTPDDRDAPLKRFLAGMMQAGRARKALLRQAGFSGNFMRRHVWAETISRAARIDRDKGRIYFAEDDRFYLIRDVTDICTQYVEWLIGEYVAYGDFELEPRFRFTETNLAAAREAMGEDVDSTPGAAAHYEYEGEG